MGNSFHFVFREFSTHSAKNNKIQNEAVPCKVCATNKTFFLLFLILLVFIFLFFCQTFNIVLAHKNCIRKYFWVFHSSCYLLVYAPWYKKYYHFSWYKYTHRRKKEKKRKPPRIWYSSTCLTCNSRNFQYPSISRVSLYGMNVIFMMMTMNKLLHSGCVLFLFISWYVIYVYADTISFNTIYWRWFLAFFLHNSSLSLTEINHWW